MVWLRETVTKPGTETGAAILTHTDGTNGTWQRMNQDESKTSIPCYLMAVVHPATAAGAGADGSSSPIVTTYRRAATLGPTSREEVPAIMQGA